MYRNHKQKLKSPIKCKEGGAQDSKRKKNLDSSEVEVLLQEVNTKQAVICCSKSSEYKIKNQLWDAVTHLVNAVFKEGHTADKVKKNIVRSKLI